MKIQRNNAINSLEWSITRNEKRERTQKTIIKIAIPLIILVILVGTIAYPERLLYDISLKGINYVLRNIVYTAIGLASTLFLFFFVNKSFPYAKRAYSINNSGINIAKGEQYQKYLWEEFECYYAYSERARVSAQVDCDFEDKNYSAEQLLRNAVYNTEKYTMGDIFYLKKKNKNFISRLCKKFVVVYGEVENSVAISKTLSHYLSRKKMSNLSDLGLVFYEFK